MTALPKPGLQAVPDAKSAHAPRLARIVLRILAIVTVISVCTYFYEMMEAPLAAQHAGAVWSVFALLIVFPAAAAWIVARKGLAAISETLRRRQDSEHEQSLIRIILVGVVIVYTFLALQGRADSTNDGWLIVCMSAGLATAWALLISVIVRPEISPIRRVFTINADLWTTTGLIYFGGDITAPLYGLVLWMVLGHGFRYGVKYLLLAAAVSFVGFTVVVFFSPYWQSVQGLAIGLWLALLIVPAYVASLIRKLHLAKAAAEEASRAKSRFLATISHELRTPLNTVIGMGGLLKVTTLDNEQRAMVQSMRSAAGTLLSQINTILDFSKIEAGRMTAKARPFDLAVLVAEVESMFRLQAQAKGLEFHVNLAPGTPLRIAADMDLLRNVVVNLVGNALKFTERGHVRVAFAAGPVRARQANLTVTVADTGIGIPKEKWDTVFESFRQADETVGRRYGGTGLGLTIVKQLAAILGGTVRLESEVGKGSVFAVEIPVELADGAERPARLPEGERIFFVSADAPLASKIAGVIAAAGGQTVEVAQIGRLASAVRLAAGSTARPIVVGNAASLDLSRAAFAKAVHDALPAKTPILILVEGESVGEPGPCRDYFAEIEPARVDGHLPATLYAATVLANGGAAKPAEAAERPSRAMRILVAEDNGVNRRLFARMLELAGHRVIAVANGEEALDVLDREPVDLAIFDVNMPVLNGIDAVKLHRFAHLHDERLPIVALTADATNEGRERCLAAGFDAVVLKPIEAEELQRVVDTYAAPARTAPGAPPAPPPETAAGDGKVARHPKSGGALPPIVDPAALEALRALYRSPAMFAELVEEFIADTGRLVDALVAAVAANDVTAARDQAHALRSSAAHFGARRLHQTCLGFGRIGADEMRMRAAALTGELKQGYALVVDVLRREVPEVREILRA